MGVDRLAERRGGKGGASAEQESERVPIWAAAMEAHLLVDGQALLVLAMRRVGLNELVAEEDRGFGKKVEKGMGIWYVWDLEELQNEGLSVVYTISKRVGMDLLQLVHHGHRSTIRSINDKSLC